MADLSKELSKELNKDFAYCEDTISRKAAINSLHMHLMYRMGTDSNKKRLDDWINGVPSAQPERKRGRWIRNDNGTYSCSLCHSWIPEEQYYYARFCLYCGADMRGEDDG